MASKKRGGRDFVKGNPGGPGRPKLIPEVLGLPRLDKDSYNRYLNKTLQHNKEELLQIMNDPTMPALEVWLANIVLKGIEGGDSGRLEPFLNRAIGPIKHELELSGNVALAEKMKKARTRAGIDTD